MLWTDLCLMFTIRRIVSTTNLTALLSRDPAFVVDPRVRLVFKHQGGYATLERDEDGGGAAGAKV